MTTKFWSHPDIVAGKWPNTGNPFGCSERSDVRAALSASLPFQVQFPFLLSFYWYSLPVAMITNLAASNNPSSFLQVWVRNTK